MAVGLLVALLLGTIIWTCLTIALGASRVGAGYGEVRKLRPGGVLIDLMGQHVLAMGIARDPHFAGRAVLPRPVYGHDASLAVLPGGGGVLVGDGNALVRCDWQFIARDVTPLAALLKEDGEWDIRHVVADEKWIALVAREGRSAAKPDRAVLLAWERRAGPAGRVACELPPWVTGLHVDGRRDRAVVFHSDAVRTVDLATGAVRNTGIRGDWSVADYDADRGCLLTGDAFAGRKPVVVRADPDDWRQHRIGEASAAAWGPGDLIYYCRGASELWQCTSEGKRHERILLIKEARPGPMGSAMGDIVSPSTPRGLLRASRDRSVLSFAYAWGKLPREPDQFGLVLLDTKARELRILEGVHASANRRLLPAP